ncbi:MAG: hypothetical protein Unbinned1819contig1001_46 [Prokaryotic dsDNA virus sp.]|nr:MAG: hypothetical protein Unbinned1819contig1001_46 [Prokaryotic dsDNA virus sp.]|tara:strand:+ start:26118 stop:26486 length:369 start_codon:yes stop_codon:yes gene_type:complete
MINIDKEKRAFSMLLWVPYCLPVEYDDALAAAGVYTKQQRRRSDDALLKFEQHNQYESSTELKAFKYLIKTGHFPESQLFSPAKAKCGYYSKQLKQSRRSKPDNKESRREYRRIRAISKANM